MQFFYTNKGSPKVSNNIYDSVFRVNRYVVTISNYKADYSQKVSVSNKTYSSPKLPKYDMVTKDYYT